MQTLDLCIRPDGAFDLEKFIDPHPRQVEFLRAIYKYRRVLYGGARGGGKSYILRWSLIHYLFWCFANGHSGVRVGLFCTTFKELWSRQWVKLLKEAPPELGYFVERHMEFRLHKEFGGGVIQFCNIADPTAYQSSEFAAIAIDEITLIPDLAEIMAVLSGSLRWPDIDWCPMFAGTNPNGPSHSQVKRWWITKDFTANEDRNKNPEDYKFIQCLPTDNPRLPKSYIEQELGTLPDHLRAPWLEGSWDALSGQRFDRFRTHVHVISGYHTFEQRQAYVESLGPTQYFGSIDWGTYDPMAFGIFGVTTIANPLPHQPKLKVTLMNETLERGLNSRLQAQLVRNSIPPSIQLSAPCYLDNQAWEEESDGLSGAQKFFQEGVPVQQVQKSRAMGWDAVDELLHWECGVKEDGSLDHREIRREPILQIFECCAVTIQQLQDALWNPMKPKDILHPRSFRDDLLDMLRYFCLTHIKGSAIDEAPTWIQQQQLIAKSMEESAKRSKRMRGFSRSSSRGRFF